MRRSPANCFPGRKPASCSMSASAVKRSSLALELRDGHKTLATKTFNAPQSPPQERLPTRSAKDSGSSFPWASSLPGWRRTCRARKAKTPRTSSRLSIASPDLPKQWQGYEGVDISLPLHQQAGGLRQDLAGTCLHRLPWNNGSAWAARWCSAPARTPKRLCTAARRWRSFVPGRFERDRDPAADQRLGNLYAQKPDPDPSAQAGRESGNAHVRASSTCKARSRPAKPTCRW